VLIGAHVSSAGGPIRAIERGEEMGASVVQLHTQSPRVWKPAGRSDDLLVRAHECLAASPLVRKAFCHGSYLINLATNDPVLLERSRAALVENLRVAGGIGASGLVLHLGSHLGGGFDSCVRQVARELVRAMDAAALLGSPCAILVENAAGAGGTVGRSFDELAGVLEAAGWDERLSTCVDTQHLFASGVGFETLEEADAVVDSVANTVGLARLGCIHLNDSKVPLGANRDRHANLGEGFIGAKALGSLLSHPALQAVPAVLEVPGAQRKGPARQDLERARAIRRAGLRRRSAATRRPPPVPRPVPDGRRGSRRDP
jgi:deoxyribonuclease-4